VFFVFRIDRGSNSETKPSVQESLGIFQLIDQIEAAVDKLLERQVPVHFGKKGGDYGNCFGSTKLLTQYWTGKWHTILLISFIFC
jgi:hypothetical protein